MITQMWQGHKEQFQNSGVSIERHVHLSALPIGPAHPCPVACWLADCGPLPVFTFLNDWGEKNKKKEYFVT